VSSALRGRLAHVSALPEVHPRDQRWPEYCSGDQRCIDVGTHWNGASAFVLALRHNVPLVGTAVEDVWKPAVSVSERARVLALVSWICWPVFAGTLSQYILRRKPG
jgi:hypothetical protein